MHIIKQINAKSTKFIIVPQCFINVISNITLPSKGLSPTGDRRGWRALRRV